MWLGPLLLGLALVLFGILVLIMPQLLVILVSGFFIFIGLSLVGLSFGLRRRVTYRRMDGFAHGDE